MAISLKHTTQATGTDAGNGEIRKAQWNEEHTLTSATNVVIGRATAGTGAVEELAPGSGLAIGTGALAANTINRIINGCFRVDQRNSGASQTVTAGAALAYAADRWYVYCTGANVTGQRIAISNAQNRYRFTGAASVTGVGLGQRIEALNSLDLAGGNAVLQVKASSSSLTSLGWAVYYATTTDSFGTLAAPTRTLISSGTFTITATDATYTASFAVPSAATTGLEIVFTGGALLASQTLTIGDVQLEAGSVATPYVRRPISLEQTLCYRYFQRHVDPPLRGVFATTTLGTQMAMTIAEMRAAPTATISGTLSIYDGTATGTATAISAQSSNIKCIEMNLTAATGTFTAGRPAIVYVNTGAGAISLAAEL